MLMDRMEVKGKAPREKERLQTENVNIRMGKMKNK